MLEQSKKPTAYSYIRMSSQQQLKGDSLRRQLELSQTYADKNELFLDDTLRDIGVSAWTGDNIKDGALGRFVGMVKAGEVKRGSYLLVESLDRLSRRQVRFAAPPFIELINSGVIVVTLADNQVYSEASVDDNFTQLMMSLAIMSRAHEESQIKSQRVRKAHANRREKAAQGIGRFSHKMFGWLDTHEVNGKFTYTLNHRAAIVRQIFDWYDAGLGQLVITRKLNEAKTETLFGRDTGWHQALVGRLLKNEAVIGTYQPLQTVDRKQVPYGPPLKNYLPAAIPDDLFWRCQRSATRVIASGNKGKKLSNLFTGYGECSSCGGQIRMSQSATRRGTVRYLSCYQKYRNPDFECSGGTFRYDSVENAILDHVSEFHADRLFASPDKAKQIESISVEIGAGETILRDLEARYDNLVRSLEMINDEDVRTDVAVQMAKRKTEIAMAKTTLSDLQAQLHRVSSADDLDDIVGRLKQDRAAWETMGNDEVYLSRSRLAQAMTNFITKIVFDFDTSEFVVKCGEARFYQFAKDGKLLNKITQDTLFRFKQPIHKLHLNRDGSVAYIEQIVPWQKTQGQIAEQMREAGNSEADISKAIETTRRILKYAGIELRDETARPINPRLNDHDVIAIKAKRKAAIGST